ncbi:hypothetical protein K2173_021603 [Erythroxylum novogranatense]|uniref:Uncharacterized protein n=1 Tax=Erythroxylum novogranatense TaxID=1862640 RepID=A0AAV8TR35_9ROSI|nr:hypothetical protein K2173_021603 [Erythroxylum novogranatense]
MCRTTEFHGFNSGSDKALKIRAFCVRLSGFNDSPKTFPESLTLIYLPRTKASELVVNGSKVKPDSAAFSVLHRVKTEIGKAAFMSRERVRGSEGLRFAVYMGQERLLKGMYTKDQKEGWMLDCSCGLEQECMVVGVSKVDVCVALEGKMALNVGVAMVFKRKCGFGSVLDVIPEDNNDGEESDAADGCTMGDTEECMEMMERDLEVIRWAVDVGFWVVCLGMGFLLSKATSKSLRRL